MRPWENGSAKVAREEIDADTGLTPVRFNQSIAQVVDGPVRFRRLESNDLLAVAVVQSTAVSYLLQPFTCLPSMTGAARLALVDAAATFLSSAQTQSAPEDKELHLEFGRRRFNDIAAALERHGGMVGVDAVRQQLLRP